MPLAGGQDGLKHTRNLRFQLTLFQPGGADYANRITECPAGFENFLMGLNEILKLIPSNIYFVNFYTCICQIHNILNT
jgi:hypothetical protein